VTERVLTTRELNRALLARQLLLERSSMSVVRAVDRVAGLQTQYAPSAYVSLWSRLRDFRRDALTRALEQRRVVEATLLRSTIHIVSPRDYHLFGAGVRRGRQEWWLRAVRKELGDLDITKVAETVRGWFADGPRKAPDLKRALADEGYPSFVWSGLGGWLDLVRVPPSGTWEQRRADLLELADRWVGPSSATEAEGLEHLVRRYLGGFGPATPNDIASWAGVPVTSLLPVVERLPLRTFRDEQGRTLFDLPRAPLPDADTPAPVRFIPTWEATLLVHARRAQVLPERFRPLVFDTKTPHSVPTFTVDGAVAGRWRYEGGRVLLEPFEPLPRRTRRELEDEAGGLAAFHAD
jgi:hypothetical protein